MTVVPGLPEDIESVFGAFPQVKLAYLFGSRASGRTGPLSDYDFAVYLDEPDVLKRFDVRVQLMDILSRKLQTNNVDVIVLNDAQGPELKYEVIKNGVLLFQVEPFKVIVEPRILNEYFDFHYSLVKHGLTKEP
ncbi:MAG: nucleotidyltransferase domain-containing protein [Chloroflexi bacterium]|nr:nucleotidyltransferase domain-containing protein [Chloroflexota bacterium]